VQSTCPAEVPSPSARRGASSTDNAPTAPSPTPTYPLLIMDFRPYPGAGRVPNRLINSDLGVVVDPRTTSPLLIMDFRPHPGAGRVPDGLINSG